MIRIFIVLVLMAAPLALNGWTAKPAALKNDFRFVVLADRANSPNQKAFEMVLKDIERLSPDFVVTVGDLIQGYKDSAGTVNDWDSILPCLKVLSCPVYLTPGNHDITTPNVRNIFIKKTGRNPYYSFDHQSSHFIILDNTLVKTADQMDPDQMKWLENDLKAFKNKSGIYVFMHKPFWPFGIGAGKPDRLHDLFKRYRVTAVFTGHWHNYASEVFDGIRYVVMGSSGAELRGGTEENVSLANFYQYLWVTVRDGKFSPALMRAGNTFAIDWVTLKEETFAHDLAGKAVDLRGPSFQEGKTPREFQTDLKLVNLTDKPIKTEVLWETGQNWQALSPKTEVEIAPGDTLKKSFKFKGPGILYPLPLMKVAYPFGRDKVFTIEKYAPEVAKIIDCPRAKKAPVVDGNFAATEWLGAGKAVEFCNGYGDTEPALNDPTEVFFLHDGENLYLAAVCHDTAMTKLKATKTVRDEPVNKDDYLGFYLSPNQDTVYQIYINPLGTVWDQQVDNVRNSENEKWNGNYQVQCERKDKEWRLEMKIPLKDIGLAKLTKNSQIRMNIRRCQQYNKQLALWIFNWDYLTQNYGILNFK
ncbi:metallophosphoesterase [candidate division TA06 bacterium]|nr:metallophosphoesterase [candidate division TA06 bacterium]